MILKLRLIKYIIKELLKIRNNRFVTIKTLLTNILKIVLKLILYFWQLENDGFEMNLSHFILSIF